MYITSVPRNDSGLSQEGEACGVKSKEFVGGFAKPCKRKQCAPGLACETYAFTCGVCKKQIGKMYSIFPATSITKRTDILFDLRLK